MSKIPVYLYMRCSTKKQEASLPGQIIDCAEFAVSNGYAIIEKFVDYGRSAYRDVVRSNYDAMLIKCNKRNVHNILVFDLSRFTRKDFLEVFDDIRQLQRLGITIIDIKGAEYDLTTQWGRMHLDMDISKNHRESEQKSELLQSRIKIKRNKGLCHGVPPFGYQSAETEGGRKWIEDSSTSGIVKKMFKMYASQDMNPTEITHWLNSQNILTTRKNPWRQTNVKNVFKNPSYGGFHVHKGDYDNLTKAQISTFISKKLWKNAYDKAHDGGKRKHTPMRKNRLTGYVKCGVCDGNANSVSGDGGIKYACYCCGQYRFGACEIKNKVHLVNLELTVIELWKALVKKESLAKITKRVVDKAIQEMQDESESAQPLLDEVETRNSNLMRLTKQSLQNPDVEAIGILMDQEQSKLETARRALSKLNAPVSRPSKDQLKALRKLFKEEFNLMNTVGDLLPRIGQITITGENMVTIKAFGVTQENILISRSIGNPTVVFPDLGKAYSTQEDEN